MKQGKFMPAVFAAVVILIAMMAYYSFANINYVTVIGPPNNTWFSNGSWTSDGTLKYASASIVDITFNCSAATIDEDSNVGNLSLLLSGPDSIVLVINKTNSTDVANDTGYMFNVTNFAEGKYFWTCWAENISAANHSKSVQNYSFYVDTHKPHIIDISKPIAGFNTSTRTQEFNWTANDNLDTHFLCNLSILQSPNVTIMVTNGSLNNTIIQNLPDGNYMWNVTCWDGTNMSSNRNTSETRKLTIDNVPPSAVTLAANGSNFSSSTVTLNWTATDATSSIANCTIFLDNSSNATVWRIANSEVSYSLAGVAEGRHVWSVSNCTDPMANMNTTWSVQGKARHFNVDLTNPSPSLSLSSSSVTLLGSLTISCSASDTRDTGAYAGFSVLLPNGGYSSDLDGTFTDTSVIGTYTVTCSATDNSGRSASTQSTFTVGSEVTGGGGGGSSGGATTVATASVSTTISSIIPGTPAVVKVSNSKIPVSEIKLEVNEEASGVKVSVATINTLPSGTVADVSKVYKYLDIKKDNLDDANLKSAKISFSVSREWLTDNGIVPAKVVLKRYTTQWQELTTSGVGSDVDNFYFEAETPGFSTFAIGVKAVASAEEVEEEAPVEEAPVEEAPAEEAPVVPAAPAKSLAWLYVVIVVVVVGILAAFFFLRKKKK